MKKDNDADHNESADGLLQLVTHFSNKGLNLPITLFVKGSIISGTLIGRTEYLDQFSSDFTIGWGKESTDALKDAFGLNKETEGDDDDDDFRTLHYIHLKDAKVFSPGKQPLPRLRTH